MIRFNLQHKNIDYTLALHVGGSISLLSAASVCAWRKNRLLQVPHPTTKGSCAYAITRHGRSSRQSTLILTIEGAKDVRLADHRMSESAPIGKARSRCPTRRQ